MAEMKNRLHRVCGHCGLSRREARLEGAYPCVSYEDGEILRHLWTWFCNDACGTEVHPRAETLADTTKPREGAVPA